jgi:hypothetical protein
VTLPVVVEQEEKRVFRTIPQNSGQKLLDVKL